MFWKVQRRGSKEASSPAQERLIFYLARTERSPGGGRPRQNTRGGYVGSIPANATSEQVTALWEKAKHKLDTYPEMTTAERDDLLNRLRSELPTTQTPLVPDISKEVIDRRLNEV